MTDLLRLTGVEPLALGHLRAIYPHPGDPDLLIKLMRADAVAKRWGPGASWVKRVPRALHYTGFLREISEALMLAARHPEANVPVARPQGLVDTDLGLAIVVEAVRGEDGALGPTLDGLVRRDGAAAALRGQVDALFADLARCGVIVGDVHPGNIVFGQTARDRRLGQAPRLTLVDGYGEKFFVPLPSMSRFVNDWQRQRVYRRLLRKISRLTGEVR
jgi:hypothetical protein